MPYTYKNFQILLFVTIFFFKFFCYLRVQLLNKYHIELRPFFLNLLILGKFKVKGNFKFIFYVFLNLLRSLLNLNFYQIILFKPLTTCYLAYTATLAPNRLIQLQYQFTSSKSSPNKLLKKMIATTISSVWLLHFVFVILQVSDFKEMTLSALTLQMGYEMSTRVGIIDENPYSAFAFLLVYVVSISSRIHSTKKIKQIN